MAKKEFSIDKGFEQLDEIIGKLEAEDIQLADAVKHYGEGVNLVKKCKDSLDQVEKELIVLNGTEDNNEL